MMMRRISSSWEMIVIVCSLMFIGEKASRLSWADKCKHFDITNRSMYLGDDFHCLGSCREDEDEDDEDL
eukprot:7233605-Heterocapsa_arctica.AAC.1